MVHEYKLGGEFFAQLSAWDAQIAARVAAAGCSRCGGPLHQANYRRKPRGGLLAEAGEAFTVRYSLCCGRRGCRKRALPPSLRFLGRRVYLEVVVLLASTWAWLAATAQRAVPATGVPQRTLRRWGWWWTRTFPTLPTWAELRARFAPPPPGDSSLPSSLVTRLETELVEKKRGETAGVSVVILAAKLLAPLTTCSVCGVSRFLRGIGVTVPVA